MRELARGMDMNLNGRDLNGMGPSGTPTSRYAAFRRVRTRHLSARWLEPVAGRRWFGP